MSEAPRPRAAAPSAATSPGARLWVRLLATAAAVLFAGPALAQGGVDSGALGEALDAAGLERLELLDKLSNGDLADLPTERFDEELWADAVRGALASGRNIRARELTEQILARDANSFIGHALLGVVFHIGEGNLPRAFFHLDKSRGLFEALHSAAPSGDAPWRWHSMIVSQLAAVSGEMGRHEDKVQLLLEHDALYMPPRPADRGWPLMRLRRYDEAREAAEAALRLDNQPDQVAHALTALCAIEAEQQDRVAGYQACLRSAEHERQEARPGPTPFTNAAEASLGMLHFDQAEQLILEGADRFAYGTVSNPYLDLTHLYLSQGRTAEALESMREMVRWRNSQPPFMDEQNRSEAELASALFLLVAGHPLESAHITRRIMERPDRTGFTSSESEQMEAAAALVDSLVHRTAAELALEKAACAGPLEASKALATALRWRLQAWSSSRRAASMLAEERFLLATLRPYLAGSAEMPEWLEPELVAAVGPGVVGAAVDRAQEIETLDRADGYFLAYRAEIACVRGSRRACLDLADRAMEALPGSEVLLSTRLAARGAQAADALGQRGRALELFDRVLQTDPGAVRRLGLDLPVTITAASGAVASAARSSLARSPRFREVSGGGSFSIEIDAREQGATAAFGITDRVRPYAPGVFFNSAKFFDLEWQVYGRLQTTLPEHERTLYWQHPTAEKAIRLNYAFAADTSGDGAAVPRLTAVNVMGIRYRHDVCTHWITEGTGIETVLQNLGAANFDPEFTPQHEADFVAQYNRQTGRSLTLKRRRGWRQRLDVLAGS
ncbi:MAG: hypothetical protein AAF725_17920 [Acidobacteriota bacterium]